MVKTKLFLDLY